MLLILLIMLFGLCRGVYNTSPPAAFAILITLLLLAKYSLPCFACYVPPCLYLY
jgi:hypothetical protein